MCPLETNRYHLVQTSPSMVLSKIEIRSYIPIQYYRVPYFLFLEVSKNWGKCVLFYIYQFTTRAIYIVHCVLII